MQEKEIWKDIKGYEGFYQASNFGRIKSVERFISHRSVKMKIKGRILKCVISNVGYQVVRLSKEGVCRVYFVHQLVAIAFKNHVPNGFKLVVDHKDSNKLNNRADNLRVVTNRENMSFVRKNGTSKYTGVSWNTKHNKWRSAIYVNGKTKCLGSFDNEYKAHLAYQKELLIIKSEKVC